MQRRINPREANRMMQRMGMQLKQIDDVTRVVIESATKKIIIDEPEVAIVTVQGQTVYQIGGGRTREEDPASASSDENVLLLKKSKGLFGQDKWNAPGGKILPGEDAEQCAVRGSRGDTTRDRRSRSNG